MMKLNDGLGHMERSAHSWDMPQVTLPFPDRFALVSMRSCHGIPNPKQILKDGDIVNIDVTPILDGFTAIHRGLSW